jgi:hypothetical protein
MVHTPTSGSNINLSPLSQSLNLTSDLINTSTSNSHINLSFSCQSFNSRNDKFTDTISNRYGLTTSKDNGIKSELLLAVSRSSIPSSSISENDVTYPTPSTASFDDPIRTSTELHPFKDYAYLQETASSLQSENSRLRFELDQLRGKVEFLERERQYILNLSSTLQI